MPTEYDDVIHIEPGQNIDALGGDDLIFWAGGNATIEGGADNLDPNLYQAYDLDRGFANGDMVRVDGDTGAKIHMTSWNAGTMKIGDGTLHMTGIERIFGSAGDDTIRAGGITEFGPDGLGVSIFSGAGDDDIVGSAGGDAIDPGAGNDIVRAGAGDDFVNSSTGDDLIYGGSGMDNIRWGIGDAFWHNPGNDTIYGGEDRDIINVWVTEGPRWAGEPVAGANVTILQTRQWDDMRGTATVGTGDGGTATLIFQGFEQGWTHEGDDTIDGSAARVWGDVGIHWNTRWGDDLITGTAGNDTLEGGEGSDTIEGGAGDDLISANGDFFDMGAPGDGDADTLIFRTGHGHDTVLAFDVGIDILDVAGREFTVEQTAAGALLDFGDGDTILLAGVDDFT